MPTAKFVFVALLAGVIAGYGLGKSHAGENDHKDHAHDDHAHESHGHDTADADDHSDHVTRVDGVEILHAWTRATNAGSASIFMEITNEGDEDVTLIGGDTDIGGAVSVIAIDYANGGKPKDLGRFPIAAGSHIDLTPDGLFLEVSQLEGDLIEGTTFAMHIELDPIGEVEVFVEVEAENANAHSHAGHNH